MKYPDTESTVLELKREIPKYDQITKTMIGFSNQHGGKLIIGIENNGISEETASIAMESLSKAIYEASPRLNLTLSSNEGEAEKLVSSIH